MKEVLLLVLLLAAVLADSADIPPLQNLPAPPTKKPERIEWFKQMKGIHIKSPAQFRDLIQRNGSSPLFDTHIVIEFYSKNCHFCKTFKPFWNQIVDNNRQRYNEEGKPKTIEFLSIDTQDQYELKRRYHVQGTPTFIYLRPGTKGQTAITFTDGERNVETLTQWIEDQIFITRRHQPGAVFEEIEWEDQNVTDPHTQFFFELDEILKEHEGDQKEQARLTFSSQQEAMTIQQFLDTVVEFGKTIQQVDQLQAKMQKKTALLKEQSGEVSSVGKKAESDMVLWWQVSSFLGGTLLGMVATYILIIWCLFAKAESKAKYAQIEA